MTTGKLVCLGSPSITRMRELHKTHVTTSPVVPDNLVASKSA